MEHELTRIFTLNTSLYLSGLIAAALFFGMVGIRELQVKRLDGFLYLALSLFFFVAHFLYLFNLPDKTPIGSSENLDMFWQWLVSVFAPALIALYLVVGIYNFILAHVKLGLVKMFFGLSLICFLYLLGQNWAVDIKGILTVLWCLVWFDVEFQTAT